MKTYNKKRILSVTFIVEIFLMLQLFSNHIIAQDVSVKFGGFVKTDFMFDTREVVSIREGHFLLYPANIKNDINGVDINDNPNFNILSIQTRLNAKVTGPDAFGAKTSGLVEGAFFGHSDGDINGFRLRHAYVNFEWENTSVLIGQYWHPMFITEVFPSVISFNTGVPFQPFSRNPQIRISQRISNIIVSFTAASQRDFASSGPNGTSSEYLRNSAVPLLDLQLMYKSKDFIIGTGGDYKSLKPRLISDKNYQATNKVNSFAFLGFSKFQYDQFSIKLEGLYGSNLTDFCMLGGYAVTSKDSVTGIEDYTDINTYSFWTDLSYGKGFSFGLFAGLTKNLGSNEVISGSYYSRGSNIDKVYRVSPRMQVDSGKARFAAEIEYTSAYYGMPDNKGKVLNSSAVSNTRFLVATYYFF